MNLYSRILTGLFADRRVGLFFVDNEAHSLEVLRTLGTTISSLAINATGITIVTLLMALAILA